MSVNVDSILDTIKKMLGINQDDDSFDVDIVVNINAAIGQLTQIGIGPSYGFMITDSGDTFEDFLGDDVGRLQMVIQYIYLRTRLDFDPPQTGSHVSALKEHLQEIEWRLHAQSEIDKEN